MPSNTTFYEDDVIHRASLAKGEDLHTELIAIIARIDALVETEAELKRSAIEEKDDAETQVRNAEFREERLEEVVEELRDTIDQLKEDRTESQHEINRLNGEIAGLERQLEASN